MGLRIFFWAMLGIIIGLLVFIVTAGQTGDAVIDVSVAPFMVAGGLIGTAIGVVHARRQRGRRDI